MTLQNTLLSTLLNDLPTGPSPSSTGGATVHRLSDMRGGWFVGDFAPAALRTTAAEVAVKRLPAGTTEAEHVHRIATEVVLVASGTLSVAGRILTSGEILVLEPGTPSAATALDDCVLVVVKSPSAPADKHLVTPPTLES